MILSGYVLETIIIWLWYTLVVKKEIHAKSNEADRILRRTIKLIIQEIGIENINPQDFKKTRKTMMFICSQCNKEYEAIALYI